MEASGQITVAVLGSRSIILNGDRLDVHDVGTLGQIDISTSPVAGPLSCWVGSGFGIGTSNPVTHLDQHGSLWEVLASKSQSIGVEKSAGQGTIDIPFNIFRGPVNGVLVVRFDRSGNWMVNSTIIGGRVSLSEEVALNRGVGGSEPLPINLVEIIGLENERADGTGSRAGLHSDGDLSEEDVFSTLDGRRVGLRRDGKLSTVCSRVCHTGAILKYPIIALSLGEVGGNCLSQSIVARAGFLGRVAVRKGLSAGQTGSEGEAGCRED